MKITRYADEVYNKWRREQAGGKWPLTKFCFQLSVGHFMVPLGQDAFA